MMDNIVNSLIETGIPAIVIAIAVFVVFVLKEIPSFMSNRDKRIHIQRDIDIYNSWYRNSLDESEGEQLKKSIDDRVSSLLVPVAQKKPIQTLRSILSFLLDIFLIVVGVLFVSIGVYNKNEPGGLFDLVVGMSSFLVGSLAFSIDHDKKKK